MKPVITVLLPAYNAQEYLKETIESILNQSFKDFELLIVNDQSTDSTVDIVNSYKDERIRLMNNKYQKGIVGALNTGIEEAAGEYIARIDGDDVAMPNRLERQLEFMQEHPDIGLAGTWYEMFGVYEGVRVMPLDHDSIKATMLFHGALAHPTVMMKKGILIENNLRYDQEFVWSEDLDLWLRMVEVTKLANVPEVLMKYRVHKTNVGTVHNVKQAERVTELRLRQLKKLNIEPTEKELALHEKLGDWKFEDTKEFLNETIAWFKKLITANKNTKVYMEPQFSRVLAQTLIEMNKASKFFSVRRIFRSIWFIKLESGLNLFSKVKFSLKLLKSIIWK